MAHVERRRLGGRDHAEARRRFLAAGLDQRRAESRIIPRREPGIDPLRREIHRL